MENKFKIFDTIAEWQSAELGSNVVSLIREDNSIRYSGGFATYPDYSTVAKILRINNVDVLPDTSGTIDLGKVITEHQDISHLASKSELSTKQDVIEDLVEIRDNADLAENSVQHIIANDITYNPLNGEIDLGKIVTSVKTINGESIEGSGNIEIGGTDVDLSEYATKLDLNNKVDKVSGKQLSTEDFTTALKDKLSGLKNYDDAAINGAISSLQTQLNTLVSGDASTAIESFNEIIAFLDGVQDTQDLSSIISSIEQQIASKQDKINDLETIRSGAAKGATALQSYTEKYTGTITGIKMNGASKGTSGVVDLGTVITSHQDISGKADKSSLAAVATSGSYNDLSNKPTIPAEQVNADWNATSGKAQILNKPTIPSAVTESTVSGWGFTKNTGTVTGIKLNGSSKGTSGVVDLGNVVTSVKINGSSKAPSSGVVDLGTVGTYSKPSTGIPKTDLASAVQTSLGKADTALQSYTEQYQGTVSAISTSEAIDDVNEVPNVKYVAQTLTDAQKTQARTNIGAASSTMVDNMNDLLDSVNTDLADLTSNKQDALVSGTNIKTVNNTTLLGSGNVSVGTITGISANGTSVATSGVANIPAATTSKYGVTKLSSATNSTSTTLAATASAVKAAYDLANSYKGTVTSVKINGTTKNPSSGVVDLGTVLTAHQDISGKQDKLVSGTNIKTINGTSILGSGDITIEGGSSSGSSAYSEVNHGTSDTTFTLTPNTFHVWDEVTELIITLGSETSGVANEYIFQFTSGSTATSLSLPDSIVWANNDVPVIESDTVYQINILKGLGSLLKFAKIKQKNTLSLNNNTVTSEYPVASDIFVICHAINSSNNMTGEMEGTILAGQTSVTVEPCDPVNCDNATEITYIDPVEDDVYMYIY